MDQYHYYMHISLFEADSNLWSYSGLQEEDQVQFMGKAIQPCLKYQNLQEHQGIEPNVILYKVLKGVEYKYNFIHMLNKPAPGKHRIDDITQKDYTPKLKDQTYNFHQDC